MKRFVDRRQHKRFMAREGALAAMQPAFSLVGEIENIGRGGLALTYYQAGDRMLKNDEMSLMNILFNDTLCLKNVRFRIVSDFERDSDMPPPVRMRTCRVQFNGLSDRQFHELEDFIAIHTSGMIPDRRSAPERRMPPENRTAPSKKIRGYDRRAGLERRRNRLNVITFY